MSLNTKVLIIGGGPSGLLLSQLLMNNGIDTIVLEKQSREHVLKRIRAGVIEPQSIALLEKAGIGRRINQEGQVHSGTILSSEDKFFRIDFQKTTGKSVTVFGQTEITKDLYAAQDRINAKIFHKVENVKINDLHSKHSNVSLELDSGKKETI